MNSESARKRRLSSETAHDVQLGWAGENRVIGIRGDDGDGVLGVTQRSGAQPVANAARRLRAAIEETKRAPKAHSFDTTPRVRARLAPELKAQLVAFYKTYGASPENPDGISQAECARLLKIDKSQFNQLLKKSDRLDEQDGHADGKKTTKNLPRRKRSSPTVLEIDLPRGTDKVVIVLPDGRKFTGRFVNVVSKAGRAIRERRERHERAVSKAGRAIRERAKPARKP